MSTRAESPRRAVRAERPRGRRRLLALTVALAVAATIATVALASQGGSRPKPPPPGALALTAGGARLARIPLAPFVRSGHVDRAALAAAVLAAIPARALVQSASARIDYAYERAAAARAASSVGAAGGRIEVPRRVLAAQIAAPATQQQLKNDCEATSLSILLSTLGVSVDQLKLQSQLPRSGPLDPQGDVWGDPAEGFVGRADGSGPRGGFGVYERPVARLALRYHRRLTDLTGSPAVAVYDRLRAGHAVMAWIGLADGPYASWRSPSGRPVTVNYGEHAIVLAGIYPDGSLSVRNPLGSGAPERWSSGEFELEWGRLGRRALGA